MFHQVEGLVVDRNIDLGHLKWMLEAFCHPFSKYRTSAGDLFRPHYSPFT